MCSLFTGESVPVTKTPLPDTRHSSSSRNTVFNMKEHSKHTLFCGTQVIQTRYYGNQKVRAVVVRTGKLSYVNTLFDRKENAVQVILDIMH
jgi:cation-transporting ATPase 13A3/4/5